MRGGARELDAGRRVGGQVTCQRPERGHRGGWLPEHRGVGLEPDRPAVGEHAELGVAGAGVGGERQHLSLLSLAPVLYYGDEIGMGDNIWLGDRDGGGRTPDAVDARPQRPAFRGATRSGCTCRRSRTRSTVIRRSTSGVQQLKAGSFLQWTRR